VAKRKTMRERIAEMSTAKRVELAKKLTDRVTDHLLYVLELHETIALLYIRPYSPRRFQPRTQRMHS
jgi:hypothetical protein